jgi:hypothetical protein
MELTEVLRSARPRIGASGRLVGCAVVVGACCALVACGSPDRRDATAPVSVAPPETGIDQATARIDAAAESSTQVAALVDAGTATAPATRLDPPTSDQRIDPAHYVNSLRYGWGDMAPAMEAFRIVALNRGWTTAAADLWSPFVYDVIVKESAGCPHARGGDIYASGSCTDLLVQGQRPDSGFGQVTPVLYGPSGIVCQQAGLCSQRQIIDTAWNSMVALVVTLETLGRFPWCDYEGATRLHNCDLIPRDARPKP